MQLTIDEALIRHLPLPLAELYHSVQRPYRKPLEQFLSTCQLWEAGLKLLGAMLVAEYARLDHKDPAIQKRLRNLARPALGHWWEFTKTLLPVLAKANPDRFQPINKLLLDSTVRDMPQAAGLDVALQQEHDAPRPVPPRTTVQLRNLFDRLIWLRNQEVGHGALGQRKSSFYAQMCEKLLPGVVEVWTRLDVLAGRHLVYIADVRRLPSGQLSVDRYELTGETGRILEPLLMRASEANELPCPGQIYLQDPPAGDGKPVVPAVSLHPLVIFDPEEQEVMFLNERRGRGQLEYLCYSSGRTVDLKEVEQQELLSRLLDMEVNDERLAEWARKAAKEVEEDEPRLEGEPASISETGESAAAEESGGSRPPLAATTESGGSRSPLAATEESGGLRPPLATVAPAAAITAVPPAAPTVVSATAIPVGKPIPLAMPSTAGRRIGDFALLSILGEGGMGVVYRARQISLGREVALKCLHPGGNLERFQREIKALGRIKHPNLVEIFTSGSDGEQWFYAMELLEGATLASVCSQLQEHMSTTTELTLKTWDVSVKSACEKSRQAEKSLSSPTTPAETNGQDAFQHPHARRPLAKLSGTDYVRRVVELIRQVAAALEALHKINVIHRDVKPSNIMVTPDGTHAVLMDLGLAKLVDASQGDLTRSRQFVGTLRYASPEQVHFAKNIDHRTDIYSLGATLWELLTFRPMFEATENTSPFDLEKRILFEEPDSVRSFNRAVSPELDAIISKCLEKDPKDRYATAQQLADDLDKFLKGEPLPVPAKTLGQRGRNVVRWFKRHRVVVSAGLMLLVLAGASALAYRWWSQQRVTVAYFAHFTKKFGAPVGAERLEPEQVAQRGFSYKLFARAGRVEKVEVVNGAGQPTSRHDTSVLLDSTDNVSRECRYDFAYDDTGNVTAEAALDRAGEVIWKFNYTSFSNKNKTLGYYTDRDGNFRPRTASGAARLTFTWAENGLLEEVRYFDVQNRPQPDNDGSFGVRFERNEAGLPTQSSELDAEGNPANNLLGYCKIKNSYDAHGNLTQSAFFDAKDRPTRHKHGFGRRKYEYDEHGNQVTQSFWTADGKAAWHVDGYHALARKYDAAGLQIESAYRDDANKPVIRRGGYHRVVFVNNEFDEAVKATFYDVKGKITHHKDGNSGWTAAYDAHGFRTASDYFDENGKPTLHVDGNAGWRAEFDSRGNRTKVSFVDGAGKLAPINWGYAYRENTFDEHGNITTTSYFDEHGKPTAPRNQAYCKIAWKYNDRNQQIEESYWNERGQPVRHKDGYAKLAKTYDEHGQWLSYTYFDENDRSVRSAFNDSYQVVAKRDRLGRLIEKAFLDENGAALRIREKYFHDDWGNILEITWWDAKDRLSSRRINRYDDRNNLIEEVNYNASGGLILARGNYARMDAQHDRHGHVLKRSYRGLKDEPIRHSDGYFQIAYSYDDFDNILRIDYLNDSGQPTRFTNDNYTAIAYAYDRWRNRITMTYFDELNRPVANRFGKFAGWKSQYDAFGNCTERIFLNERGEPAPTGDLNVKAVSKFDRCSQRTETRFYDARDKLVTNRYFGYAVGKWVYDKNRCVEASFFDERDQPVYGRVSVKSVAPGGQGARHGLKVNDVLFSYRGVELHFADKFHALRDAAPPAEKAKDLIVYRAGTFLPPMELNLNAPDGFELEDRAGPLIRKLSRD